MASAAPVSVSEASPRIIHGLSTKCFANPYTSVKSSADFLDSIASLSIPTDWYSKLLALFDTPTQTEIRRHSGDDSNYTHKQKLRDHLKIIYARLNGQLDDHLGALTDSEILLIKDKIIEGAANCTAGFYNRVFTIVSSLIMPKSSISQLLFWARMHIVETAGHMLTDEVHAHNRVTVVASEPYGTLPNSVDDAHAGALTDQTITTFLQQQFDALYTPSTIVSLIIDELKTVVHSKNYEDFKEDGYQIEACKPFITYLCNCLELKLEDTLSETRIEEEDEVHYQIHCSLMNSRTKTDELGDQWTFPTGINWSVVGRHIHQCLLNHGYFEHIAADTAEIEALKTHTRIAAKYDPDQLVKLLTTEQHRPAVFEALVEHLMAHAHWDAICQLYQRSDELSRLVFAQFKGYILASEHSASNLINAFKCDTPEDLSALLTLLAQLTTIERQEALRQINRDGQNFLLATLSRKHNYSIEPLLNFVENPFLFDPAYQQQLLIATDSTKPSALTAAIHHCPEAVAPILRIAQINTETLKAILLQTNSDGWDALMLAARYQISVFPEIVHAINSLESEDKNTVIARIISKQDEIFNLHAIMAENKNVAKGIEALIDFIMTHCRQDDACRFLTKTGPDAENILTLAVIKYPSLLAPILTSITQLTDDALKIRILTTLLIHRNSQDTTAFLAAIQNCPHAALAIIDSIKSIENEAQRKALLRDVLTQRTVKGENFLGLAKAEPKVITALLQTAKDLDDDSATLKALLTQIDSDLCSVLMHVTKNLPTLIPTLLQAAKDLNDNKATLRSLLTYVGSNGKSVPMCAIIYGHSSTLPHILQAVKDLDDDNETLKALLIHTTHQGRNLIMGTAHYQPTNIELLVQIAKDLNDNGETLKAMLTQYTEDDEIDALILAAKFQPAAVIPLLQAAKELNDNGETLKTMLMKVSKNDQIDALMLAAIYQPTAVAPLIQAATDLNDDGATLKTLLLRKNTHDCASLLFACCNQPTAVPLLLEAAKGLNDNNATLKCMLEKISATGSSVLLFAIEYQPTVVATLLQAAKALNDNGETLKTLLKHKDAFDFSPLLLACCDQPTVVPVLLQAAKDLNDHDETLKFILEQTTELDCSVLLGAIEKQPTAVAPLLQAAKELNDNGETLRKLLTQKTRTGISPLLLASAQQPSVIPALLQAAKALNDNGETLKCMLEQTTDDGQPVLLHAIEKQPSVIAPLLQAAKDLNDDNKTLIALLKHLTPPRDESVLEFAVRKQPDALETLIDYIVQLPNATQIEILCNNRQGEYKALRLAGQLEPASLGKFAPTLACFTFAKQCQELTAVFDRYMDDTTFEHIFTTLESASASDYRYQARHLFLSAISHRTDFIEAHTFSVPFLIATLKDYAQMVNNITHSWLDHLLGGARRNLYKRTLRALIEMLKSGEKNDRSIQAGIALDKPLKTICEIIQRIPESDIANQSRSDIVPQHGEGTGGGAREHEMPKQDDSIRACAGAPAGLDEDMDGVTQTHNPDDLGAAMAADVGPGIDPEISNISQYALSLGRGMTLASEPENIAGTGAAVECK